MDQLKKKLRNTTGGNMTWGVFKAYVVIRLLQKSALEYYIKYGLIRAKNCINLLLIKWLSIIMSFSFVLFHVDSTSRKQLGSDL